MNGLMAWMERCILPTVAKIGAQKHLVTLRDTFIGTLPATMAESVAVTINAIIRDLPQEFVSIYATSLEASKGILVVSNIVIGIDNFVWNSTLAIAGLISAFSWGYNLTKTYNVNELAGGTASLATLISGVIFTPNNTAELAAEVPEKIANTINEAEIGASITNNRLAVSPWGQLNLNHLGGNALFTVMIMGALSTIIFCRLIQAGLTIKVPDSVPPVVSKAFAAILPATTALYVVAIINFTVSKFSGGQLLIDLIQKYIVELFLGLSQGLDAVLIVTVFIQIFWFSGIHGPNVLAPVLEGIWGQAQLINIDIFQKDYEEEAGAAAVLAAIDDGKAYMQICGPSDALAWSDNSNDAIILIIAILLLSKRADYLAVGELLLGLGILNINGPIMFGLLVVLSPIMFIPFVIMPLAATTIGWAATYFELVTLVSQQVAWVTPPLLSSFLATGTGRRTPIVALVCVVVTFLIWTPFVITANKMNPALGEGEQ